MNVGEYIKKLRLNAGYSQEQLGNLLGVQRAAVQKWECGRVQNLKRETIKKLAEVFNVSPASFIDTIDEPTKEISPTINDDEIKVALFGGDKEVTDEMWDEVKSYVEYIKQKHSKK